MLLEAISKGLGVSDNHDLDDLAGTWVDDPEFDAAIKAFDVVDIRPNGLYEASQGQAEP